MSSIFSSKARDVFDVLARERALLAFDFDGTLAPIVSNRAESRMRQATRSLLRALALLHPCAVVSGRSRSDVAARVEAIPLVAVIGNHGAEAGYGPIDRSRRARIVAWKLALEGALRREPGIEIEDKRFSLAVHYRRAPSWSTALDAVTRVASVLEGASVFGGHAVVNLVPDEAPHKGTAMEALVRRIGDRPVLYVGDDRTDEDAFRAPCVDVSVRVGASPTSAARWHVPDQAAVDELLRTLLVTRMRLDGVGDAWDRLVRAVET